MISPVDIVRSEVFGLRVAISFLTRVPMGALPDNPRMLRQAVPWFPIVGAAIGAVQGLLYVGMSELATPLVAAATSVAASLLLTGAFHYDGLADMADAFGGGWTVEQRMTILKDSRLGTYGTAALCLALIIEVAAVSSFDPWTGFRALIVAHGVSRAATVVVMGRARLGGDGLGAAYMHDIGWREVAAAGWFGLVALWAGYGPGALGEEEAVSAGFATMTVAVAAVSAATAAVVALSYRKIGGVTGDVLGAVQVVALLAILVSLGA